MRRGAVLDLGRKWSVPDDNEIQWRPCGGGPFRSSQDLRKPPTRDQLSPEHSNWGLARQRVPLSDCRTADRPCP